MKKFFLSSQNELFTLALLTLNYVSRQTLNGEAISI